MKLVSKTAESNLTIVKNHATYRDFEFKELSDQAREMLLSTLTSGATCRYFEAYLFLIGKRVTEQTLVGRSMLSLASGFIGALNSEKFLDVGIYMRKKHTSTFIQALSKLNVHASSLEGLGTGREITAQEAQLAATFEAQFFSEEKIWLLGGWWAVNKNGQRFHLPLYPLYVRMGRAYTQRLYDVTVAYVRGRSVVQIFAIRALVRFIANTNEVTERHLLDRTFTAKFLRDFLIDFTQLSYKGGKGMQASTILNGWNNHFIPFVRDVLVPAGLFAAPLGGYPNPRGKDTSGVLSNVALEDGIHVKTKLLTRVPLHLSDAEAMQTLFVDIRRDFNLIRQWADSEVLRTNSYIDRRIALESQGTPRIIQPVGTNTSGHKILSSPDNPQALANAAATLKKFGFVPRGVKGQDVKLLFPSPLNETAQELGLPVTGSIVPYLAILVAEHPAITTAYLENFQLYNSIGVRIGLVKTDGGYYLVGDKQRRGPADAEQQIPLSDAALSAVNGLLRLTEPVRKYMREHGDDDWRYLILSCGKGFGKPYRIRKLAPQTCFEERLRSIAAGLHAHCDIPLPQAQALAKRFSLGRLRASAGTLVYLETQSVHKMSEALGHKYFDPDLLSRYLPPALQEFFQERWIRIFQNGILAEALKDSPYLLQSTDFETKEELTSFLSKHALKLLPSTEVTTPESPSQSEVAFGLDVGIFTVLLGIERAVSQANSPTANAVHWATLTRALVKYIESNANYRVDLKDQLAIAKRLADPAQMEEFLYA